MSTVYIKGYSGRTMQNYHTDKDCHLLSDDVKEISKTKANRRGLEVCSACAGTAKTFRGVRRGESIPSQIRNGRYEKK